MKETEKGRGIEQERIGGGQEEARLKRGRGWEKEQSNDTEPQPIIKSITSTAPLQGF